VIYEPCNVANRTKHQCNIQVFEMPPPSHAQNEVMPCAVPSQPFAVGKKKQLNSIEITSRSSPAFSEKKQHCNYMCSDTTWHFDKGKE